MPSTTKFQLPLPPFSNSQEIHAALDKSLQPKQLRAMKGKKSLSVKWFAGARDARNTSDIELAASDLGSSSKVSLLCWV
jgi:hypothetical protein